MNGRFNAEPAGYWHERKHKMHDDMPTKEEIEKYQREGHIKKTERLLAKMEGVK